MNPIGGLNIPKVRLPKTVFFFSPLKQKGTKFGPFWVNFIVLTGNICDSKSV